MRMVGEFGYPMYDFHSHILPCLDDGAKDVTITEMLLNETSEMGIDGIVATPHFYATDCKPEDFLNKRATAVKGLLSVYDEAKHPKLYLGAEVAYFYGIGSAKELYKLAIDGTNLILVEMPFVSWNDQILTEIQNIQDKLKLRPVIAHMERYLRFQSKKIFRKVMDAGFDMQFNAEFLADSSNRKMINKLLACDSISLIGSDCHNITSRPQNLSCGVAGLLKYKRGASALEKISKRSLTYIAEAIPISKAV